MVKSSKELLAKDESKVLAELQKNSKESIDTIAKHCGLSRQKAWRIIKHLEDNKIIWGYTAIADEEQNGLKHFVLLVKRNSLSFEASVKKEIMLEKLDEYLPDVLRIEDIFFTHGSFDAVITFYVPDIVSAKKFVQELYKRGDKYLGEYFLLETLVPVRKKGLKNPQIKSLVEYL